MSTKMTSVNPIWHWAVNIKTIGLQITHIREDIVTVRTDTYIRFTGNNIIWKGQQRQSL